MNPFSSKLEMKDLPVEACVRCAACGEKVKSGEEHQCKPKEENNDENSKAS